MDKLPVYVRKGNDPSEDRRLSFPLPEGWQSFSARMREQGVAIDGNRGLLTINRTHTPTGELMGFYGPFGVSGSSLSVVLAEVENRLEHFLLNLGYTTEFV